MQRIIFPGNHRQPCEARYGIFFDDIDGLFKGAHIVVVQSSATGGSSLWNTDEGRDAVLNRILAQDLAGVRVEYVRFSVILDGSTGQHGVHLPIRFDLQDYIDRGNPHDVADVPASDLRASVLQLLGKGDKKYTILTYHIVGGCARFFTDFNEREHLSNEEMGRLLAAVGYQGGAGA